MPWRGNLEMPGNLFALSRSLTCAWHWERVGFLARLWIARRHTITEHPGRIQAAFARFAPIWTQVVEVLAACNHKWPICNWQFSLAPTQHVIITTIYRCPQVRYVQLTYALVGRKLHADFPLLSETQISLYYNTSACLYFYILAVVAETRTGKL